MDLIADVRRARSVSTFLPLLRPTRESQGLIREEKITHERVIFGRHAPLVKLTH